MEPLRERRWMDERKYSENKPNIQLNSKRIPYKLTLEATNARLVACNGDCGSKIAVIINQCVNGETVM